MARNYSVTFKAGNTPHANSKQPQTLRGAAVGLLRHFNVVQHESKLSTTMQLYDILKKYYRVKIIQGRQIETQQR